jgi:glutaredoxin 1
MQIEIYGTSWCSSCVQAKKLCEAKDYEYSYTDVDDSDSLHRLEERLGHRVKAVPQIFYNGEHLADGFAGLRMLLQNS